MISEIEKLKTAWGRREGILCRTSRKKADREKVETANYEADKAMRLYLLAKYGKSDIIGGVGL